MKSNTLVKYNQALCRRLRLKLILLLKNYKIKFIKLFKRLFDIFLISITMPVTLPFLILVGVLIRLDSKGNVLFSQKRVGQNGKLFDFYKFRSMYSNAEEVKKELENKNESSDGVIFKIKNDPRITRVGKYLRKYSIDELPQLYNVLIGDMTLVGPRPPVPKEVSLYKLKDHKRLEVTPGITCLWQVSGRSDIPFNKQVLLDLEYIESSGTIYDLRILLRTIPAVVFGKGAY